MLQFLYSRYTLIPALEEAEMSSSPTSVILGLTDTLLQSISGARNAAQFEGFWFNPQ